MGKLRFFIAIIVGKISAFLLDKLFKRGTNTPGIIMLKICPDALARFALPTTICVTGTNGKTGTSNLLTHIIRNSGKTVVNNSKGSNMAPGLVSALVTDCTLSGKVKSDVAVLEVDERSSQFIYTKFVPDYILCTNLFRDSIMRNGHSEFIKA
jgi:UDP-N-acetylmuramyl tripeptide synthase